MKTHHEGHQCRLRAGSDMRALVQEACQGPVRDAVAAHGAQLTALSASDLRPLNLRDFQVRPVNPRHNLQNPESM